jgi:hypothetical protein
MAWATLFEGNTDFNWFKSVVTDANLLKITHLDTQVRGTLIGFKSGRTEIVQFDEAGLVFSEPRIIRTEVEAQIILFPKLAIFGNRRIGLRNSLGFDPQRIKVEGDKVPIYYEQNQSNAAIVTTQTTINRRNVAQDIVPENNARKGLIVKNNAKKDAFINLGTDATATAFIYSLAPGATLEVTPIFLGRISVFFKDSNPSNPTQTFTGETLAVTEFV